MNGKTHVAGGITLATVLTLTSGLYSPEEISIVGVSTFGVYLAGASIGAILPDVDTRTSTISKKHKVGSFFIRLFLTHRGFTHSLLAYSLLSVILFTLSLILPIPLGMDNAMIVGIMVGYGSHILLDALNPKGVPLFYPYKKMYSVGNIDTGGLTELVIRLGIYVLNVYLICGKILGGYWEYALEIIGG